MPKALATFRKGKPEFIGCYKKGCEHVKIPVTFGDEHEIHSTFQGLGGVDRITWKLGSLMRGFELGKTFGGSGYCNCPNCQTLFGGVIVISNGKFKKPTIIGYDPEPS